ncbi:GLPGLI family protein [Chryseobacterium vrystaatense]|uniref:GLPGLI family protein n=1 Tax=Chryseobacterium vrystaatense TaxID=307480 RepID=A0A1M5PRI6_9FLAO|nr:GLPGLI family protein [Chryseobacterium vrystaatense]SHH04384.1 GLPGLI family protein [Chryseobacterium vrystaatense]
MKIIASTFLVFGFMTASAQNAVMEINYETKIIQDSINKNQINIYTSTLLCNTLESSYYSREAKAFYSRNSKATNTISTNYGAIAKYPKSVGSVYKSRNSLSVSMPVGRYIFTYEEPDLTWEILNEIKDIKGFKSRLAKTITDTGQTFYAWFTDEIAIPDGPFRFKGLSGLVLEVYNKNRTIEIYATDIKKSEEIIEPLNYTADIKTKSKKQFLEARKTYQENPAVYNGNMRVFDEHGNERTKNMTDRVKSMNTFLD